MENSGMITKGGDGPYSYFRNSTVQAEGSNLAKDLIRNGIKEYLEVSKDSRLISIADLGCSVGPNTFSCINNIIKAVQENLIMNNNNNNHQEKNIDHEFQVFFNDLVHNDFNTLFKSLPSFSSSSSAAAAAVAASDMIKYYVAGVPGSFYNRLFPRSSINIMHTSFSLNWLTKVPQDVKNNYKHTRITYASSSCEIFWAYRDQFVKDATDFFKARSDELVPGGLLMILMPCREDGSLPSQSDTIHIIECLGEVLGDMVKEGLIAEDLLNSFNLPVFFPSISELKQAISSTKNLRIVKHEQIFHEPRLKTREKMQLSKMHLRAVMEDMLCEHFGPKFIDEIFDRFLSKLEKLSATNPRYFDHSFVEKNDRITVLVVKYI